MVFFCRRISSHRRSIQFFSSLLLHVHVYSLLKPYYAWHWATIPVRAQQSVCFDRGRIRPSQISLLDGFYLRSCTALPALSICFPIEWIFSIYDAFLKAPGPNGIPCFAPGWHGSNSFGDTATPYLDADDTDDWVFFDVRFDSIQTFVPVISKPYSLFAKCVVLQMLQGRRTQIG